jgi:tRNA(Leu) C34 or U34 (ribose-2'-O)-methylase TrmL
MSQQKAQDPWVEIAENVAKYHELMKPKARYDAGFACVGLHNPICMGNVGSVLRAAGCFGAAMVAMCRAEYKKASTDTNHQYCKTPFLMVDDLHDIIPYSCVPVAVELLPGAKNILDYEHPRRAFYIFGGEQETLGKKVISWCRDVIYIPTEYSLNLAACVNVVLFDRMMKQLKAANAGQNDGTRG